MNKPVCMFVANCMNKPVCMFVEQTRMLNKPVCMFVANCMNKPVCMFVVNCIFSVDLSCAFSQANKSGTSQLKLAWKVIQDIR